MAETALLRAGMPTAAEILAPTPGALLRRRIFRHWGLLIGGTILGGDRADGAAGAAHRPARSLRPAARPQADSADLARQRQGHLGAPARHRPARARLPLAPALRRADFAADRLLGHADLRRHRHRARRARRLFRRPRRHGRQLHRHHAAVDAGGAGGAGRGVHHRLVADRRHLGARPADLGPLRRGHAQRHPADPRARVHHRGAGARLLHHAHPVHRSRAQRRSTT